MHEKTTKNNEFYENCTQYFEFLVINSRNITTQKEKKFKRIRLIIVLEVLGIPC